MVEGASTVARGRSLAAASGVTFVGAVISALAGFLFTVALGRSLGSTDTGVVLQVVGTFTIGLGLAKFGLDTTAIWLLPRSRVDDPAAVRGTVRGLLGVGLVAGAAVAGGLALLGPLMFTDEVSDALRGSLWFLPAAVITTVALAATRGLGGVGPYVLIGQISVPGLRPLAILVIGALGGGALAASVTWAGILGLAALPTLWVVASQVRRLERSADVAPSRLNRATVLHAGRFTVPRAVSSAIELAQQWLDVVMVGVLAGPAAAGIYGAATRFIGAGMVPSTSMRIVVAPQFSSFLHRGDRAGAQQVYRVTARWIILLSVPIFVLLWLFGGTVLSLVGPDFRAGGALLGVLAIGATVFVCTGNVQALLLMSGRSGWVAVNKAIVLTVLVTGLVLAVPEWGTTGAAAVWSLAYVTDAVLASIQVSRLVGIRLELGKVAVALTAAAIPFGLAGVAGRFWFGDQLPGLAVGAGAGLALFTATVWLLRRPLELDRALALLRRRGPSNGSESKESA